jgi:cytochrome c biogenesis protein CcdA
MTVRKTGNQFAKYASSTIFAPAIFIIPFPTMVNIEHQPNQMMFHGGYFVKNFMAFFVMFAFYHLLINKKLRENLLLSSFLLGYLLIVAFSAFAQSERFHLPGMPLFMVFAAYGVHHLETKQKTIFNGYLILIGLAVIVWSWFKLAGRGLA